MTAVLDRSIYAAHNTADTTGAERMGALDFDLSAELHATAPPEARGLARDQVRLLVSYRSDGRIVHTTFREIPTFLDAGDVLVINTSATLNAAVDARREDGTALELHLSTALPGGLWMVEVRRPEGNATVPFPDVRRGERLLLPAGAAATLHAPYRGVRLWIATLELPYPLDEYLARHGFPIRYAYVTERWPIRYYQTVYATHPGSAEMPSAGRAFTPTVITQLVARGVQVVPLVLHAGVASLEAHEPPPEEPYRVPGSTARAVNSARAAGSRVIAVGTTVVRALETVTDEAGITHPGEGWTGTIVTPERGIRGADGLLTGFHEPRASHLALLEAVAGREHVRAAYEAALRGGYLWHEFGDLHLILP